MGRSVDNARALALSHAARGVNRSTSWGQGNLSKSKRLPCLSILSVVEIEKKAAGGKAARQQRSSSCDGSRQCQKSVMSAAEGGAWEGAGGEGKRLCGML